MYDVSPLNETVSRTSVKTAGPAVMMLLALA